LATQLGCPIIQLSLLIPIVYHPISILKQKANNDPSSNPWHKNITKFQKAVVKRNFVNVGGLLSSFFFFFFFFLCGEMEWCARGVEKHTKREKAYKLQIHLLQTDAISQKFPPSKLG
jgi:hypothetical protein